MNRRDFFKLSSAVVLAASWPTSVLLASKQAETDEEKFKRLIATGLVRDEDFEFHGVVEVFIPEGTIIERCRFRQMAAERNMFLSKNFPYRFTMSDCHYNFVK